MEKLKYRRILLKISGEALLGAQEFGIDYEPVLKISLHLLGRIKKGCPKLTSRTAP